MLARILCTREGIKLVFIEPAMLQALETLEAWEFLLALERKLALLFPDDLPDDLSPNLVNALFLPNF